MMMGLVGFLGFISILNGKAGSKKQTLGKGGNFRHNEVVCKDKQKNNLVIGRIHMAQQNSVKLRPFNNFPKLSKF